MAPRGLTDAEIKELEYPCLVICIRAEGSPLAQHNVYEAVASSIGVIGGGELHIKGDKEVTGIYFADRFAWFGHITTSHSAAAIAFYEADPAMGIL